MKTFAVCLCLGIVVCNFLLAVVDGMFFVYVGHPLSSFPWEDGKRFAAMVALTVVWFLLATWIYNEW